MTLSKSSDFITLYTAQAQVVKDTLDAECVYRVKTAFVDQKYGDQAWIFKEAYSFFAQNAPRHVPIPEGAQSGIWAFVNEMWVSAQPGSWVFKLQVPRSQAVLFDARVWNKILNLQYVEADAEDGRRFEDKLSAMGITHSMQVFSTPFYPQVKSEIKKSWQRLFTSAEACPIEYVQAGLWEIRQEWIEESRRV